MRFLCETSHHSCEISLCGFSVRLFTVTMRLVKSFFVSPYNSSVRLVTASARLILVHAFSARLVTAAVRLVPVISLWDYSSKCSCEISLVVYLWDLSLWFTCKTSPRSCETSQCICETSPYDFSVRLVSAVVRRVFLVPLLVTAALRLVPAV